MPRGAPSTVASPSSSTPQSGGFHWEVRTRAPPSPVFSHGSQAARPLAHGALCAFSRGEGHCCWLFSFLRLSLPV